VVVKSLIDRFEDGSNDAELEDHLLDLPSEISGFYNMVLKKRTK